MALAVGILVVVAGAALSSDNFSDLRSPAANPGVSPQPEASAVTMQSVSASELAAHGIVLQRPTIAAVASQTTVVNAAVARFQGSKLRETVLAQVTDTFRVPNMHCTCWVVSLAPRAATANFLGGPPPGKPHTTAYLVLFFDAQSGDFVEGIQGGSSG